MEKLTDEKRNKLFFYSKFFHDNVSIHLLRAIKDLINFIFVDETADTPTKRIQQNYSWKAFKEIEKLFYESRHYEEFTERKLNEIAEENK